MGYNIFKGNLHNKHQTTDILLAKYAKTSLLEWLNQQENTPKRKKHKQT